LGSPHSTIGAKRKEKRGFSPEPPTERDQTVWISFRSNPNSRNNHWARFLLG